ncbi:hypothetical protein MTR67_008931 [Solanum verrucosum]|uniref:Uncharacterized protein n=1 Tax=Solanum verrucosum TaxID=315347 RepID=A0AAF0TE14_SOLVR|nr:hypothetical protein MTR67_008931 [Solanum verrucosum]
MKDEFPTFFVRTDKKGEGEGRASGRFAGLRCCCDVAGLLVRFWVSSPEKEEETRMEFGLGIGMGMWAAAKVKLVDIPEKVTVFNVTRRLEQNVTQLVYKWQHIANKVDDNLLLRMFLRSNIEFPFRHGQRIVHTFFTTMFVGGVDELLHEMQKSFPELGLVKEDCIEMSWIESVLFFAGFPRGTSLDVLLDWNSTTNQEYYFKGKSDYVQHPISINGLEGIWKQLKIGESEDKN